jgi:hypothetical protein
MFTSKDENSLYFHKDKKGKPHVLYVTHESYNEEVSVH